MIPFLQNMIFVNPVILAALLGLPLLWYILRITPPAPKKIFFPATTFLMGLTAQEQISKNTPWWILLLRLLVCALVIIALARPVIHPANSLDQTGSLRIVLDNSWAGAQNWTQQTKAAEDALAQAGREGREIYILTTAIAAGQDTPQHAGAMSQSQALAMLRGLKPMPWPADYNAAAQAAKTQGGKNPIFTLWLSHGLDEGNMNKLVTVLQSQGSLAITTPEPQNLPLLLRPYKAPLKQEKQDTRISINIDAPKSIADNTPVTVQAQGQNGKIFDIQSVNLTGKKLPQTVYFDIPETLHGGITGFKINGRHGAGSLHMLDNRFVKRNIGIASPADKADSAPLIEAGYYLKRALEPYANITIGEIETLIEANPAMIILPDIAAMPSDTLNKLEQWVTDGGLLLRFSGDNTSEHSDEQYLMPVTLRAGGRALSGSLSWDEPQKIAPFVEGSPLYGLTVPDDIIVRRQVLADPAQDLEGKVWAQLLDGTPIITGTTKDHGLIVLIHTTADPSWTDLPLSGLYVDLLRRLSAMAGTKSASALHLNMASLEPVMVLDGMGNLLPPPPSVQPLKTADADKTIPDPTHPPGLYGRDSIQYALNLGTALPSLNGITSLPSSVLQKHYDTEFEIDLQPYFLYTALILFCVDWIIMILLTGGLSLTTVLRRARVVPMFLLFTAISFTPIKSFAAPQDKTDYARGFYLAYIRSGQDNLDSITHSGLEGLSHVLASRTSVEPDGIVGLDPETDTLSFFPLIYWPINAQTPEPSVKTLQNIQYYLDHGGTILFDTRDNSMQGNRSSESSASTRKLRQITASLNIPPLAPITQDHVLGRSFYLLDTFPGRYADGTLWLEQKSASGRDGVSSVIIGSNDWASAWASGSDETDGRYRGGRDNRQNELALRFGVNLVMYTLTGNYKADQVHVPHILERLGR